MYTMRILLLFILFISLPALSQAPIVYELNWYEKDQGGGTIHFVSLSDQYQLSEHEDSLAVPPENLGDSETAAKEYFKLQGSYRQRCLNALGIDDNDVLFVYDYLQNKLLKFYIGGLNLIAVMSPYASAYEFPISQYDYMIGFQINPTYLKSNSTHYGRYLVAIGKTNPFTLGKMKPVIWTEIDSSLFPPNTQLQQNNPALNNGKTGETYQFNLNDLQVFTQNIMTNGNINGRHVVAINAATKTIIFEQFYKNSEAADLAALNGVDIENGEYINQFAGQLFKDMPPVIFGFLYHSFGCPGIDFIDKKVQSIYINCDNRH